MTHYRMSAAGLHTSMSERPTEAVIRIAFVVRCVDNVPVQTGHEVSCGYILDLCHAVFMWIARCTAHHTVSSKLQHYSFHLVEIASLLLSCVCCWGRQRSCSASTPMQTTVKHLRCAPSLVWRCVVFLLHSTCDAVMFDRRGRRSPLFGFLFLKPTSATVGCFGRTSHQDRVASRRTCRMLRA